MGFHHKRHTKSGLGSTLEKIPGIGETRRKKLLKAFGSVKAIRQADLSALEEVLPRQAALSVYQYFRTNEEEGTCASSQGSPGGTAVKGAPGTGNPPHHRPGEGGIFSSIQFEIEGRRVLDLFGGTGQMGIEALSGAAHCTFVDLRKEAVGIIRENLKLTGLEGQATVVQGDALAFLTRCREKYDVIFLDPPYASDLLKKGHGDHSGN